MFNTCTFVMVRYIFLCFTFIASKFTKYTNKRYLCSEICVHVQCKTKHHSSLKCSFSNYFFLADHTLFENTMTGCSDAWIINGESKDHINLKKVLWKIHLYPLKTFLKNDHHISFFCFVFYMSEHNTKYVLKCNGIEFLIFVVCRHEDVCLKG